MSRAVRSEAASYVPSSCSLSPIHVSSLKPPCGSMKPTQRPATLPTSVSRMGVPGPSTTRRLNTRNIAPLSLEGGGKWNGSPPRRTKGFRIGATREDGSSELRPHKRHHVRVGIGLDDLESRGLEVRSQLSRSIHVPIDESRTIATPRRAEPVARFPVVRRQTEEAKQSVGKPHRRGP